MLSSLDRFALRAIAKQSPDIAEFISSEKTEIAELVPSEARNPRNYLVTVLLIKIGDKAPSLLQLRLATAPAPGNDALFTEDLRILF
ncbi:hypothetical protein ES703_87634 [subsurface metagenome]